MSAGRDHLQGMLNDVLYHAEEFGAALDEWDPEDFEAYRQDLYAYAADLRDAASTLSGAIRTVRP